MQRIISDRIAEIDNTENARQHILPLLAGDETLYSSRLEEITTLIEEYLVAKSTAFAKVRDERKKNPKADRYYEERSRTADFADEAQRDKFLEMMIKIGRQMQDDTGVFTPSTGLVARDRMLLDLCMAPGGFVTVAKRTDPSYGGVLFTLPFEEGGHEIRAKDLAGFTVHNQDITLLAGDIGLSEMPSAEVDQMPDRNFITDRRLSPEAQFDVAICDGQYIRPRVREQRSTTEPVGPQEPLTYDDKIRTSQALVSCQLAIALKHLRPGGNMLVLLHKVESVNVVLLLRLFRAFADIRLYKPMYQHTAKSSFYMIASNVQSRCPEALDAIKGWQNDWLAAMCYSEKDWDGYRMQTLPRMEEILAEYDEEFIRLAEPIWDIQYTGLLKAPYNKGDAARAQPWSRQSTHRPYQARTMSQQQRGGWSRRA